MVRQSTRLADLAHSASNQPVAANKLIDSTFSSSLSTFLGTLVWHSGQLCEVG